MRELDTRQQQNAAEHAVLLQQLASAVRRSDSMRDSCDAAEVRVAELEGGEVQLTRTIADLRGEVEALWHTLGHAAKESDALGRELRELHRGASPRRPAASPLSVTAAVGSPPGPSTGAAALLSTSPHTAAGRSVASPYDPYARSAFDGSPRAVDANRRRRREAQEDRLREIEERVSGLLASRLSGAPPRHA